MKALLKTPIAITVSCLLVLSSCTREAPTAPSGSNSNTSSSSGNSTNSNNNTNTGTNTASLSTGTWNITSFTEHGESKTSEFSGINFTFASDGSVAASGAATAAGKWSASGTSFTLTLGDNDPFKRLTDSWKIVELSTTTFRLDHAEANEDEHITFTKK